MAIQWRNDERRYGVISVTLHWLGAFSILAMLATAVWMMAAPDEEVERSRIVLHASLGMMLYAIIAVRLAWSWFERKPDFLSGTALEKTFARVVHAAMLLLVALQLVTGPLNIWSGGWPIGAFGLFSIPSPFDGLRPWHDGIGELHRYSGFAIVLLVGMHLAGAFKHALITRDGTLSRMLGIGGQNAEPAPTSVPGEAVVS